MKTKMRYDPTSLVDLEGAGAMGGSGGRSRKISYANSDRYDIVTIFLLTQDCTDDTVTGVATGN